MGTNVGVYRYYSKGFEDFSGWTIEPFFDVHAPTQWMVKGSTWQRALGRFSLRTGLVFFPSGIEAEQFGSPEKEDISGSELNPSLTIFFRIKG